MSVEKRLLSENQSLTTHRYAQTMCKEVNLFKIKIVTVDFFIQNDFLNKKHLFY